MLLSSEALENFLRWHDLDKSVGLDLRTPPQQLLRIRGDERCCASEAGFYEMDGIKFSYAKASQTTEKGGSFRGRRY